MIDSEKEDLLKEAISKSSRLFDEKLRECRHCKVYDLLPIVNSNAIYTWSEDPLVSLYQKQYIIQAGLIELQESYRILNSSDSELVVDDEDRRIINIDSVNVSMETLHYQATNSYLSDLEGMAAEIVMQHYRDFSRFFDATPETVASLLDSFWAQFEVYDKHEEAFLVLGATPEMSFDQIQKIYRELASKHHPDRGGSRDDFVKIRQAFELIKTRFKV